MAIPTAAITPVGGKVPFDTALMVRVRPLELKIEAMKKKVMMANKARSEMETAKREIGEMYREQLKEVQARAEELQNKLMHAESGAESKAHPTARGSPWLRPPLGAASQS